MTFKELKAAALELPEESRADLAQSLLQSLSATAGDPEHDRIWAEEAARRYQELRETPETTIPVEEVVSKLRAAVR